MRLQGRIKLGYYPTPPRIADALRRWLVYPEQPTAVLDPCCGEGAALRALAAGARAETYGVELDEARAEKAKAVLAHVAKGAYELARISHGAFGLMLLNPPYDTTITAEEERAIRKELAFLRGTWRYLAPGGVLIYIVPESVMTEPVCRLLAYRFEDWRAYRFPDPEWSTYEQIVLIARRRRVDGPPGEEWKELLQRCQEGLPVLPGEPEATYPVPATPVPVPVFRSGVFDAEEIAPKAASSPVWARVRQALGSWDDRAKGRPPLPLHQGHLALLLAGGELDGVAGGGPSLHLVKGRVRKQVDREVEDRGDGDSVQVKETDRYEIHLSVLRPDGELVRIA